MNKFGLYYSIGVLIIFLVLSLITNRWGFFLWSIAPCFIGIMMSVNPNKKEHNK